MRDWLEAACSAVWVVDPQTRTVTVYHSLSRVAVLKEPETLDGGDLLPGLQLPAADVFGR